MQKKSPRVANLKAAEESTISTLKITPSAPSFTSNATTKNTISQSDEAVQPVAPVSKTEQKFGNPALAASSISTVGSNSAEEKLPQAGSSGTNVVQSDVEVSPMDKKKIIMQEILDVVSKTASVAITNTLHSVGKQ